MRLLALLFLFTGIALAQANASETVSNQDERIEALLLQMQDRETGEAAVDALVASGDERLRWVFHNVMDRDLALWQNRPVAKGLEVDGQVAIHPAWQELDAEGLPTGPALATVADSELEPYRAYRRARKAADRALTTIGLLSKNPATRREAAVDLGNKRRADTFADLRNMAAEDPDPGARQAAAVSVAIMTIDGATGGQVSDQDRLDAAVVLTQAVSLRSLDLLRRQIDDDSLSPEVATAYARALAALERHKMVAEWTKHLFSGLSFASILLIMALGLAITFGLMGVINMAHGEMLMIGCVSTWACYEFIGKVLPTAWFDWYYLIALPVSFLTAAVVGLVIEMAIVRWLYQRPLDSMLATIGVSFVLIQAVRSMVGENLAKQTPSWFSGGWEIMQDVILPYNRLFIILVATATVLAVIALFRFTRYGLLLRATVQNREIAQSMGINTRLIDMTTFALGSGLAGLAGWAIFLNTNPNPGMGQTYIVDSFLVTVTGGVGNILGVVFSALGIGTLTKLLEPLSLAWFSSSVWAWVMVLLLAIIFIMRRPGGLFPDRGRLADQADRTTGSLLMRMPAWSGWAGAAAVILLGYILVPACHLTGFLSPEYVNKLGYIATFAMVAIGLDLLWGYCGAMSLCQALFFAIGAYCMGFYLINTSSTTVEGIPEALKVVMSDVSNPVRPAYLDLFTTFPGTVALGLLLPALVAGLIGLATFRSQVKGVYFAILTQAITYGAFLAVQQNSLKMGGTNGLNFYDNIFGYTFAANHDAGPLEQTRFWLYIASVTGLLVSGSLAFWFTRTGLGRVMLAMRDDETRLRFNGYQTWVWKTVVLVVSAVFAGLAGMLYTPQKPLVNPNELKTFASIMVVAWVAFGGRATVWGAALGAILISLLYEGLTSYWPDGWMFVLGTIFILVPLLFPGGLLSLPSLATAFVINHRHRSTSASRTVPEAQT